MRWFIARDLVEVACVGGRHFDSFLILCDGLVDQQQLSEEIICSVRLSRFSFSVTSTWRRHKPLKFTSGLILKRRWPSYGFLGLSLSPTSSQGYQNRSLVPFVLLQNLREFGEPPKTITKLLHTTKAWYRFSTTSQQEALRANIKLSLFCSTYVLLGFGILKLRRMNTAKKHLPGVRDLLFSCPAVLGIGEGSTYSTTSLVVANNSYQSLMDASS